MKPLSYRSRLRLKRIGLGVLAALLLVIAAAAGVVVYLERYVVYTDEGAYLSFLHPADDTSADKSTEVDASLSFPAVIMGEAGIAVRPSQDDSDTPQTDAAHPQAVRGIWLSYADLQDTAACLAAVHAMENCNTVMLQLKSSAGNIYYDTQLPERQTASVDLAAVNELIAQLHREGYYLIARLTAFADTAYALGHTSSGLQLSSGALWMDAEGYYWLNPADADTQQALCDMALELAGLGVQEIAYAGFAFPESANIAQYAELDAAAQAAALQTVAQRLTDLGAVHGFSVSFCDPAPGAPAPSADGHVILSGYDGAEAAEAAAQYQSMLRDAASLVFLTDSRDTRFQSYGILRSLEQE